MVPRQRQKLEFFFSQNLSCFRNTSVKFFNLNVPQSSFIPIKPLSKTLQNSSFIKIFLIFLQLTSMQPVAILMYCLNVAIEGYVNWKFHQLRCGPMASVLCNSLQHVCKFNHKTSNSLWHKLIVPLIDSLSTSGIEKPFTGQTTFHGAPTALTTTCHNRVLFSQRAWNLYPWNALYCGDSSSRVDRDYSATLILMHMKSTNIEIAYCCCPFLPTQQFDIFYWKLSIALRVHTFGSLDYKKMYTESVQYSVTENKATQCWNAI